MASAKDGGSQGFAQSILLFLESLHSGTWSLSSGVLMIQGLIIL